MSNFPTEMSPDEASFFETGELPLALAEQHHEEPLVPEKVVEEAPKVEEPVPAVLEPTELERFMAEERQHRVALESRLEEALRRLPQQEAPKSDAPEIPDKFEDPLGNIIQNLENLNSRFNATEQAAANREQLNQFTNACQQQKAEFEKTSPDFKDAYAHIRNLRTEDLRVMGAAEKDIPNILLQDELQLSLRAMQSGKNPAAELYAMAKRYGYAPTKAAPTTTTAQPTPAEKMAQLKAGARAATDPPKAGQDVDLTFDNLTSASNTDLDKLVADPKLWDQVVGGANGSDIFHR